MIINDKLQINEYKELICQIKGEVAKYTKVNYGESYKTIVITALKSSLITIEEVLLLQSYEYSEGAFTLIRNLFENMVIVAWLENVRAKDSIDKYVKNYYVAMEYQQAIKQLMYYKNCCSCKKEQINSLSQKTEKILSKVGITQKVARNEYWWTGQNKFSDLVKKLWEDEPTENALLIKELYYLYYKRACLSIHAGPYNNELSIGYFEYNKETMNMYMMKWSTLCLLYIVCSSVNK